MPRKLPWRSSTQQPPLKRQRTSPPHSPKNVQGEEEEEGGEEEEEDISKPVYMRPSDDRYIMVEDEFLSIAQIYTRSLHRAEYERLQREAKTKNSKRILDIQRPVDGVTRMSKETLVGRELAANLRMGEEVLRGLPGVKGAKEDSDSDSDLEIRDAAKSVWGKSSLGVLMCSPKKKERDLSARWKINPSTRAAAGFKAAEVSGDAMKRRLIAAQTRHTQKPALVKPVKQETASSTETDDEGDDDDDDDDLDAPIVRQSQPSQASSFVRSQTFPSSLSQRSQQLYRHPTALVSTQISPPPSKPLASSSLQPLVKKEVPDFDFGFGPTAPQRNTAYRGRSTAARKQGEAATRTASPPLPPPPPGSQRPKLLDTLFPTKG